MSYFLELTPCPWKFKNSPKPREAHVWDFVNKFNLNNGIGTGGCLYANPVEGADLELDGYQTPEMILVHEVQHAWEAHKGIFDQRTLPGKSVREDEVRAVQRQNDFRMKTEGEAARPHLRTTYSGQPVGVLLP